MTTIDQQLAAFLRKINDCKTNAEAIYEACENAENETRDCVNSTIETIERDICYAADKANKAQDFTADLLDRLQALMDLAYEFNSRLTSGAQPPAEVKPRHIRFLKVLKKNNGCTVAHMAGTLGVGMGAVYSYVYDLKQLGHKVAVKKKHLYLHDLVTNITAPVNTTGNNQEA